MQGGEKINALAVPGTDTHATITKAWALFESAQDNQRDEAEKLCRNLLALPEHQLNKIHRAGCHFMLAFGAKDYWHAQQAVDLYTALLNHGSGLSANIDTNSRDKNIRAELLEQAKKVLAQAQSEEKARKGSFDKEMQNFIMSHGRRPATNAAPQNYGHKMVKMPQYFVNRLAQAVETVQIEGGYKSEAKEF